MAMGWKNPLPFKIGGAPTTVELTYEQLRKALGRGPGNTQAIGPRDGLRDLWTKCEALAVATSLAHWEHAIWQAFPHTSTDFLTVWENLLGLPASDELVIRQRTVAAKYTQEIDATIPGLREQLQEIDPRFDADLIPDRYKITTIACKEFGPLPGVAGSPFGTGLWAARESTAYPNFSDDFIVRVRFSGLPTEELFAQVADLLNDVLPSWVDFEIYVLSDGPEGEGFYLDGGPDSDSFLDLTAITP
jgi:hypothetical protein